MSSTRPIQPSMRPTRRTGPFGGATSIVYSVIGDNASGGSVAWPEPFPSKAVRPCPRLSVVRTMRIRGCERARGRPQSDHPGYPRGMKTSLGGGLVHAGRDSLGDLALE